MEISLKEAFQIAVEVHGEQRDKAGLPYMGHICRVMNQMDTDEERVVAILHDVLEDLPERQEPPSMASVHAFGHMASLIQSLYGWDVYDALVALTRPKGMEYMAYIRRLSTNPLAVKVKLADLRDNTDSNRLDKLPSHESGRLIAKYVEAFRFLKPEIPPEEDMHE